MNKTQKIRRLGWALTVGLLLFLISVQPAFSERPRQKPQRASTPPVPVTSDDSEIGGDRIGNDDQFAQRVVKADTEYKQVVEQLAVTPLGPEHAALERKAQGLSNDVARSVEGCPNCPATLTAAAGMAMSEKNPEKAHGLADRAVVAAEQATNDPKQTVKLATALITRGSFLEKAGEFERAHADAKHALKVKPGDKAALGLLHSTEGRIKAGAVPTPNEAQARPAPPVAVPSPYRDPQVQLAGERALGRQQAIVFYNRAKSSNDLNDTERALEYAQAAIRADPSLPDSYMERAKALLGKKDGVRRDQLAQAINDLRTAMELWMKNGQTGRLAEANGLSAKAKNATGDYNGAQDDANRAMSYDAGYAPAYWQRGVAREALKQKELALADYAKSAELLPEYGAARDAATARLMAPENAGSVPVARPTESALHQAWIRFLGKAGGSFTLLMGAMGVLFVVLLVLWTRRRPSVVGVHTPVQDGERSLPPMRGGAEVDGLEGRTVDGGKYRVVCMLGQGGMGTVYKAYDLGLKRDVAIKRMNDFLLPDRKARERFVAEGRTGAKLRHPNIVAVYAFFMEGERALIVFEHIEGNTLHAMLNESPGRRLDFSLALKILAQLASAVDCAHGEGVIHRDLKPSNVMVYGGDKAKVMDFGISRVVQHVQATMTDTIVGTPVYMAPEQQDGVVVRESDIYTLGIMAFEMLTGMLPFRGEGQQFDKREGRFPAASALMPSLPAAVDVVFKKVLDPDFKKRYARAEDFRQALEAALSQATPPRA